MIHEEIMVTSKKTSLIMEYYWIFNFSEIFSKMLACEQLKLSFKTLK